MVVASAEEICLRGLIQPRLSRSLGVPAAVVACALAFAAFHILIYGVRAVPLDFGVGLLIGVLRAYTGSVAACAVAHSIADLGWWWVA